MELILALCIVGAVMWLLVAVTKTFTTWRGTLRPETSSVWNVHLRERIVYATNAVTLALSLLWFWLFLYHRNVLDREWVGWAVVVSLVASIIAAMIAKIACKRYTAYEATHRTYGVPASDGWRDDGR